MIKMIATDVDGTLLPEGTPDLNPEIYDVIRKLKEKGILFVAASGRQYMSMTGIFEPVKEDIIFVADNGADMIKGGEMLECRSIEKELLVEIKEYVDQLEDVYVLVSSPQYGAYTESKAQWFLDMIHQGYNLKMHQVDNILDLDVPITKFAVYCKGVDATVAAAPAEAKFANRASVVASGKYWIDFMKGNVDKGVAIKSLQDKLGILPEETMAFGDNNNDIGMLKCARESFAVASARDSVKEVAAHVLTDDIHEAVVNVLKTLI